METNIGYTPLPLNQRLLCPSCHKVHMQMWTLPFDQVWHCAGCKNTIVADQKVLDWAELVGKTILCRMGTQNTAEDRNDTIISITVVSVRGNNIEIRSQNNRINSWYKIYNDYIGNGAGCSGFHLVKVM